MRERTTRYVLLGVLAEGPASGYEIRQWIEQAIGHFWTESFGQIYPELGRLVDEKLAEPIAEDGAARERKRYRITKRGRHALETWLNRAPRPDLRRSELLLKLFFGRFGDAAQARAYLEGAGREARAQLAYLEEADRRVIAEDEGSAGLPYYRITIDAGRRAARARLEWAQASLELLDGHAQGRG